MSLEGLKDDRLVLRTFIQQMEERKASIQGSLENVKKELEEAKNEDADFRKVIESADPQLLSIGSAEEQRELRKTIREQREQIEELQKKIRSL